MLKERDSSSTLPSVGHLHHLLQCNLSWDLAAWGDEAEELHMVAGVWRHYFQLLEHLDKGSWLSNATGNQGNQMVMPWCQAGPRLGWSLKVNRGRRHGKTFGTREISIEWRAGEFRNWQWKEHWPWTHVCWTHVCVGHSLHSVLPLNVVTLDKFYNSLEEVRIRINNPYFNSVVKMKWRFVLTVTLCKVHLTF